MKNDRAQLLLSSKLTKAQGSKMRFFLDTKIEEVESSLTEIADFVVLISKNNEELIISVCAGKQTLKIVLRITDKINELF